MAFLGMQSDLNKLAARMGQRADQAPFALALALTRAAKDSKESVAAEMDRTLDQPVSFTKRGLTTKKATKRNLVASVGVLPKQWSYLKFQVMGGTRRPVRRALRAPVAKNVRLTKAGNLSPDKFAELLGARPKVGHKSVFSGVPRGIPGAKPGIWERVGDPNKIKGGKRLREENRRLADRYGLIPAQPLKARSGRAKLRQLVGWLPRARYQRRLNIAGVVREHVSKNWPRFAEQAVREALDTARPLRG